MRLASVTAALLVLALGVSSWSHAQDYVDLSRPELGQSKIDIYMRDNLHSYIVGLDATQMIDCRTLATMPRMADYTFADGTTETAADRFFTDMQIENWDKAIATELSRSGQSRDVAAAGSLFGGIDLAGMTIDDVSQTDLPFDAAGPVINTCTDAMAAASEAITEHLQYGDNIDAALQPSADNPYETRIGDTMTEELFRSVVEWPEVGPTDEAQRCVMVGELVGAYVDGSSVIRSSTQMGYAEFDPLLKDTDAMLGHYRPVLRELPEATNIFDDPKTAPYKALNRILSDGSNSQVEVLVTGAKAGLQRCLSAAGLTRTEG